jgi:hypothetical protein
MRNCASQAPRFERSGKLDRSADQNTQDIALSPPVRQAQGSWVSRHESRSVHATLALLITKIRASRYIYLNAECSGRDAGIAVHQGRELRILLHALAFS